MTAVSVTKTPGNPETTEILAEAIVRIGEGFEALQKSGLNEEAIIVLVHDNTKIAKRTIKEVIHSLRRLKGFYCRKDPK